MSTSTTTRESEPPPSSAHHAVGRPAAPDSTGLLAEQFDRANLLDRFSVIVLDEALAPAALQRLIAYILASEAEFQASTVVDASGEIRVNENTRRSLVFPSPPDEIAELVLSDVRRALPDVLVRMGARPVRPKGFDFQLAMTGDGGFFHGHVDGSDDVLSDRRLAFVLFCHVEPRAFTGGQLNIYDRLSVDRWLHDAERVTVQPEQNRMVFFPPRFVHEVTTVALASRRFDDGRFTANGWVRW